MVTLIYIFDPRSEQVMFKKGQISKLRNYFLKHAYLVQFGLRIQKNVICFDVRQLEIPRNAIQKSDVITLTWFLRHCIARNKDIILKLYTLVHWYTGNSWYIVLYYIFCFLDIFKEIIL